MFAKPERLILQNFIRRLQKRTHVWLRTRCNGTEYLPPLAKDDITDPLFYPLGRAHDPDTGDVILITELRLLADGRPRPWIRLCETGHDVETIVVDWSESLDDIVRPLLAAMIAERNNPQNAALDA